MNEREIFAAALECPTDADRRAFLDGLGDPTLCGRIEALLEQRLQLGSYLEHPPVEALAAGLDATILLGDGSTYDAANDVRFGPESMNPNPAEKDDEIPLDFLQPSTRADSLGRLAHYEILKVLGQGAFGIVLKAFDEKLQRVVAIKVLSPHLAATSPARKRFTREARASAKVRHENVVSIYAVEDEPIPYLVMEYVPGETLQKRLDDHGPLDLPDVLRLGKQIADGLAAAHAQDLIHRDVKPGNILLDTSLEDHVKITDFGLARTADDASMTQSGMIAGTPLYMAPEQALGYKLDQRADLFSFGSVLYQMVSGRPPFRASSTLAVLKRLTEDTPRPIREIIPEAPTWLCDIITKLHAKNPDERYQSAREIADVLANCEAQFKAHTALKDFSRIPRAKTQPGVWRKWVAAAAALLLPVLALAVTELAGVTHLFRQPQATTDPIKPGGDPTPPIHLAKQEPPSADPITPAMGWVSILALPDVVADHIEFGKFTRVGEEIEGDRDETPGNTARLRFPLRIAGDYEVEVMFTRTGGQNCIDLGLPIGRKRVSLLVGSYQNTSLLAILDGKNLFDNPSAVPLKLQDGHAYTLRVRVTAAGQNASVTTTLDGLPHLAWKGKLSSIFDGSGRFKAETLDLNVHPVATFLFHDLRLHMLTGEATLTRPADASKLKPGGIPTPALPDGWVQLFNGKDLTGWRYHVKYPGHWKVEDGVLTNAGSPTTLFLERTDLKDFHLRMEVKIDAGGGSGVYVRGKQSLRTTDLGIWPIAPAGVTITDDSLPSAKIRTGGSSGLGIQASSPPIKPGEWFVLEVLIRGDQLETRVNGHLALKTQRPLPSQGTLALHHSVTARPKSVVQFRKIEIKELPPVPVSKQEPLPPTFTNSIGMEFVIVPKGKSWLGGGKDKPGNREVEIPADFYLGKYEVTQEEWEQVMGENPSHFSRTGGGMDAVKDIPDADLKRFPVETVSWEDCQLFVAKLNEPQKETNWVYRLPTDREWEYACRGGPMSDKLESAFDFYFGKPTNTLLTEQANVGGELGLNRTCKVGSYEGNRLGLFDMHGNVQEWCDSGDSRKELRGGSSWRGNGSANSRFIASQGRFFGTGLRLARVPSSAPSPPAKTPPVVASPFTDADVQRIAALPAAQQIEAAFAELKRRNPGLDNQSWKPAIEGGAVAGLSFSTSHVTDIGPLRALTQLRRLQMLGGGGKGGLTDLSPLQGMKLTSLVLQYQNVSDLAPLRGMPLEVLHLWSWAGGDLTPLKGMPLQRLNVGGSGRDLDLAPIAGTASLKYLCLNVTNVSDLTPLENVPLTSFECANTRVSDLTPLHAMRLELLCVEGSPVTDLALLERMPLKRLHCDLQQASRNAEVLRGIKTLEKINEKPAAEFWEDVEQKQAADQAWLKKVAALPADQQIEEVRQELIRRNPGFDGKLRSTDGPEPKIVAGVVIDLRLCTDHITDISPVRALRGLRVVWLQGLNPESGRLTDLTPLKDMALTDVAIARNPQLSDLSPLAGMPITNLSLEYTKVPNLAILKEMPIKALWIHRTPIADLSPLAGKSLIVLLCSQSKVKTLQGLPAVAVQELHCDLAQLPDKAELARLGVTHINGKPVAEFWKEAGAIEPQAADAKPPTETAPP